VEDPYSQPSAVQAIGMECKPEKCGNLQLVEGRRCLVKVEYLGKLFSASIFRHCTDPIATFSVVILCIIASRAFCLLVATTSVKPKKLLTLPEHLSSFPFFLGFALFNL
jgi:hypothetical protein